MHNTWFTDINLVKKKHIWSLISIVFVILKEKGGMRDFNFVLLYFIMPKLNQIK